jgi:hypothetical protein
MDVGFRHYNATATGQQETMKLSKVMGFNNLLTPALGRTETGFVVCGAWLISQQP